MSEKAKDEIDSPVKLTRDDVRENFSFELDKFHQHLNNDDDLQVVVRGHLYLEHVLIQLLKEAFAEPSAIHLDRISFFQKLQMCEAMRLVPKDMISAISKVNSFRNKSAHNLDYSITEKDKLDFYNILPKIAKDLIREHDEQKGRFTAKRMKIGTALKVIVVITDIARQRYVDWKRKRSEAFENARKVLDEVKGLRPDQLT